MDNLKIMRERDRFERNDGEIIQHPVTFEPNGDDVRSVLLKKTPRSGTYGYYSSTYAKETVMNVEEHALMHIGIGYYIGSGTLAPNVRVASASWLLAHNVYDTAVAEVRATVNIWRAGWYVFNLSADFDCGASNFTYAECWLRYLDAFGAVVADQGLGNTRILFGGAGTAHTLRQYFVTFIDSATVKGVRPVFHVNTAAANVTLYNCYFHVQMLMSDLEVP